MIPNFRVSPIFFNLSKNTTKIRRIFQLNKSFLKLCEYLIMMNIKKLIRETLIRESKFQTLNANIEFTFDLYHDFGGHTKIRQLRHGPDEIIYDFDMYKLLDDAKEEIIYNIIDGVIRHNKRFVVTRLDGDNLNIVIQPEKLYSDHWNLVVITVMKKDYFTISPGQLRITV